MSLRDLLKKKDKLGEHGQEPAHNNPVPEFTFLRTTTHTQEIIAPPHHPDDRPKKEGIRSRFRSSSTASTTAGPKEDAGSDRKGDRRLSHRLHLGSRSRSASTSSVNIPADLPDIGEHEQGDEREAKWEQRATMLAKGSTLARPRSSSANYQPQTGGVSVADAGGDENIQDAIQLHEAGDLVRSTAIFGRLADPNGANNALSQVLYGLALRHGWGCAAQPDLAITYLSMAASNSAEIESLALAAGMKKGGAAKGELVLAIFELANCFRYAWGVKKDPAAARQYYETAANLGDTDAMNEVAWCYLEGFGTKKDKFQAARYLRLAEENGHKTVGNSWIWKDKYGGPPKPKGSSQA